MKPILVLNDLHIPFQRKDVLDLIRQCGGEGELDAIIFGGDLIDCKAISSFPDLDDITIEEELEAAIIFISTVRKIVGENTKLIVLKGNHELRWERYISRMHDKKLYRFIDPNILNMLKEGMTVYKNGKKYFYKGDPNLIVVDNWYYNYMKKVIVCHPINFYAQPCKNATQAVQYFLPREQFSSLICAHNHHQGMCWHMNKWTIESGCMCQEMTYMAGRTTTTEQDYGFVYIVFKKNGKIDVNNSIIYHLDPEIRCEE